MKHDDYVALYEELLTSSKYDVQCGVREATVFLAGIIKGRNKAWEYYNKACEELEKVRATHASEIAALQDELARVEAERDMLKKDRDEFAEEAGLNPDPRCKRCGKPRRHWQVYCGAACSAAAEMKL